MMWHNLAYLRCSKTLLLGIIFGSLTFAGCAEPPLNTRYGEYSGEGESSVNGTHVLGRMFENAGHTVSPAYALTPKIFKRADIIVWFPDSFDMPTEKVYQWFATWLNADDHHTLVYVGRDYDAALTYWRTILPTLPKDSDAAKEMRIESLSVESSLNRRRDSAKASIAGKAPNPDGYEPWFKSDFRDKFKPVRKLDGLTDWTRQIDASKSEIELATVLHPDDSSEAFNDSEVLLESDAGDPLVSRILWHARPVYIVSNGSFLLNLPLVNHEHRKLAGRLIEELGETPRSVVFLESDSRGPRVSEKDEPHRTGLELFTEAPFDWILLHLAIIGVIFGFARWPSFGLARPWISEAVNDFGQHIVALGGLLQATRDRTYAEEKLRQYQQSPRTASARSKGAGTTRSSHSAANRPASTRHD